MDGTLEIGDPIGRITLDAVRRAQARGWLIGSCSDRPLSDQHGVWKRANIQVDFVVGKQHLPTVRAQFEVDVYTHIGDTEVDRWFARQAGFEFVHVNEDFPAWLTELRPFERDEPISSRAPNGLVPPVHEH